MKVPINWLREYVDIEIPVERLADLLTMAGLEVEEVLYPFSYLEKVIVGRIHKIKSHPNADKLNICIIDTGNEHYKVVCGAPNIKEDLIVPLALPGCVLPSGIKVDCINIRGINSWGMLCSERELGLGDDHSGIYILPELPLGKSLDEAFGLNDAVLNIAVTPNRGDCLSILGISREVAALTNKKVKYPKYEVKEEGDPIFKYAKVTIRDPNHCFRYVARLIKGVKIRPSPWWLRARLMLAGIRSINNIVDITNYVMLEYGQPLHAFDLENIEKGHIIVRLAKEGETITTLDDIERPLDRGDLLICDEKGPIALAGVMGGLNSQIKPTTRDVLLESAYFNPTTIRKTAKRLGITTEASFRFEREIDPEGVISAAHRCAYLMQVLADGKVLPGTIDNYPTPKYNPSIYLNTKKVGKILGIDLERQTIHSYLKALGMEIKEPRADTLEVTPPPYRHDLKDDIDLIEEIIRLHGYDKIPSDLPLVSLKGLPLSSEICLREKIKEILCGLGFCEAINYAFMDPSNLDRLRLSKGHPLRNAIALVNPLTEGKSLMRTSLIPGLLDTLDYNQRQGIFNLRIFEIGKVFLPEKEGALPREIYKIAGICSGDRFLPSCHFRPEQFDFYDLKGQIEEILAQLNIKEVEFIPQSDIPYLSENASAYLVKDNEILGYLGEVHPAVREAWGLKSSAFIFEIDLNALKKFSLKRKFVALPKFPSVERDISIVVPKEFEAKTVSDLVKGMKLEYLEDIWLFDVYQGPPIDPNKRSLTYRIVYRAKDHTLTDEEVNKMHSHIVSRILQDLRVELRQ